MSDYSVKSILILLLLFASNLYANDRYKPIYDDAIKDKITINALPTEGSFLTVQVAYSSYSSYKYDYNLLATFAVLSPVFFKEGQGKGYFSIGIFNHYGDARELANRLRCVLYDPFPVAYQEGKRIPLDQFIEGNWEEDKPSITSARKKLKKI